MPVCPCTAVAVVAVVEGPEMGCNQLRSVGLDSVVDEHIVLLELGMLAMGIVEIAAIVIVRRTLERTSR